MLLGGTFIVPSVTVTSVVRQTMKATWWCGFAHRIQMVLEMHIMPKPYTTLRLLI